MAAYFHGAAEIHGDGLQTLYLMNPGFVGSTDPSAAPAANLVFLSHHQQLQLLQQQQQNFVGIPLQPENSVAQSQNILISSKYLRAAQELLDEVVSVGRGLCGEPPRTRLPDSARSGREAARGDVPDLTAAERQDLQIKKAKLVTMLDEVEQRYRQYSNHMGMVASYFEAVAGRGSARAYTALALQTISKQFRCLRDAIALQVRAAGRSLGEEESADGEAIKSIGSRLRLVDHHLRQQRALQQLGMMQHNAWRPQRGLPERAVSILRAWLFEHFLHPYPKDSDKLLLAKQTGLTRSQVSNWFINARVRLWKPMVEEMYVEDIKEQEQIQPKVKSGCSSTEPNEESTSKASSQTKTEQGSTSCTSKQGISNGAKLYDSIPIIPHSKHGNSQSMQPFSKKARNSADPLHLSADLPHALKLEMKAEEFSSRELLMKFMEAGSHSNNAGGFGAYSIGDIGRFDGEHFAPSFHGNDVSLTLGLQHCESLSMAEEEPPYLSNEAISMDNEASAFGSLGSNPQADSHASIAYASIELQNRKRFAARLLPDFVA